MAYILTFCAYKTMQIDHWYKETGWYCYNSSIVKSDNEIGKVNDKKNMT